MNDKFDKHLAPIKEILRSLLVDWILILNLKVQNTMHSTQTVILRCLIDVIACDTSSEMKLKESEFMKELDKVR